MTSSQPASRQQHPEPASSSQRGGCALGAHGPGTCTRCPVRELAPCAAIPAEDIQALEAVGGQIRLPAGGVLAREGDPRREVHTLTSGVLRRTRLLPDGRRFVYAFVLPGDFIGFSGDPDYRHTIEAVVDSTLCGFSMASVNGLRQRYREFEASLLEQACGELDANGSYLMALARMTPVERLAAFLVYLSGRQQQRGGRPGHVDLPMTRADIADHLGLTIETVSRSFSRLKQEGVLYFEHPHHIEMREPGRLRAMAGL